MVKYRADDDQRSSHYDELLSAEIKASKSVKGIHGKKDHATVRVNEINVSWFSFQVIVCIVHLMFVFKDAARAKQYLQSFKRTKMDAIVEFVASGSRLRLFIPKDSCLCVFLLGKQ